jgi:hypothetical protein
MRAWMLSFVLLAACGNGASTESTSTSTTSKDSASSKPSKGASSSATADGPMFKAKVMGMDMSKRLVDVPLDAAEMPGFVLQAPEGAQVTVGKPGGGAHVVAAGVNYSVAIREGAFDAAESKKTFAIIDPDGKVLTDTPDLVVFQRKSGSVLFGLGVTVGDKHFHCGSLATAIDFDQATVDQTVASCKTLRAVGGAAAAPSASAAASASSAPSGAPAPHAGGTPPPPKKNPTPCVCKPGDLMCSMKCNAKR